MLFLISRMFYFHGNKLNISVSHQPAPVSRVLFSRSQRMESVLGNGADLRRCCINQPKAEVDESLAAPHFPPVAPFFPLRQHPRGKCVYWGHVR